MWIVDEAEPKTVHRRWHGTIQVDHLMLLIGRQGGQEAQANVAAVACQHGCMSLPPGSSCA